MFEAIDAAGTGLQTYHTWLDVVAENIANVNDTAPTDGTVFHTKYLQAQEISGSDGIGSGVEVASMTQSRGDGVLVQDPTNPIADARGYVRHTDVDLAAQMGDLIMAQRAFQANANAVDRAKDAYDAALNIGKGV